MFAPHVWYSAKKWKRLEQASLAKSKQVEPSSLADLWTSTKLVSSGIDKYLFFKYVLAYAVGDMIGRIIG